MNDDDIKQALKPLGGIFGGTVCIRCRKSFGRRVEIAICDDCDLADKERNQAIEQQERERKQAAKRARWKEIAGIYHDGDPAKLPQDCMRELHQAWNPEHRYGATIAGDGLGKSYLLWLLIGKAREAKREFVVKDASEIRSELIAMARHGNDSQPVKNLIRPEILAIDNFGLSKSTEAADELWSHVLEKRTQKQRPTIIATPYTSGELLGRFGTGAFGAKDTVIGQKIVKRLGPPHNWIINTGTGQLTRPTA